MIKGNILVPCGTLLEAAGRKAEVCVPYHDLHLPLLQETGFEFDLTSYSALRLGLACPRPQRITTPR